MPYHVVLVYPEVLLFLGRRVCRRKVIPSRSDRFVRCGYSCADVVGSGLAIHAISMTDVSSYRRLLEASGLKRILDPNMKELERMNQRLRKVRSDLS